MCKYKYAQDVINWFFVMGINSTIMNSNSFLSMQYSTRHSLILETPVMTWSAQAGLMQLEMLFVIGT